MRVVFCTLGLLFVIMVIVVTANDTMEQNEMYTLRQSEMDRQDQLVSHDAHQSWYLAQRQIYQAAIDKANRDMEGYENQMSRRSQFREQLVRSLK